MPTCCRWPRQCPSWSVAASSEGFKRHLARLAPRCACIETLRSTQPRLTVHQQPSQRYGHSNGSQLVAQQSVTPAEIAPCRVFWNDYIAAMLLPRCDGPATSCESPEPPSGDSRGGGFMAQPKGQPSDRAGDRGALTARSRVFGIHVAGAISSVNALPHGGDGVGDVGATVEGTDATGKPLGQQTAAAMV